MGFFRLMRSCFHPIADELVETGGVCACPDGAQKVCSLPVARPSLRTISMSSVPDGPFCEAEERIRQLPQYNKKSIKSKYRMGEVLGEGGFSVVRRVRKKATGQEFACKIMEFPHPDDDYYQECMSREALFNEIEIASRICCDNISLVEEFFLSKSKVYLVQSLMEGGVLCDDIMLRPDQRYKEEEAKRIIEQVLKGVAYLHARNVVHRDLKLQNLMLAKQGDLSNIRIVDFGLSKQIISLTNTTCGSPLFVAPEILSRSNSGHGLPVDIWSIGAILYSLLAGVSPFYAEKEFHLFENIENCDYDFEDPVWSGISQSAKDLIRQCLVLDPTKRLKANAALRHPWFHKLEEGTNDTQKEQLSYRILSKKSFNNRLLWVPGSTRID